MKRNIVLLVAFICLTFSLSGQNCVLLEKGYAINSSGITYYQKLNMEKSWYKLKDDKKAELVNAFNANVLNGTEKPHTTTSYTVIVKDLKRDTIETIIYAMTINGVEYTFPCYCVNGVNFYYRVQGATYYVSNGDTVGAGFMSPQVVPNNLKVGDRLPAYEDISTLITGTTSFTDKQRVLAGYRKVETIERGTNRLNTQNFKYETGDWRVTKYEQVFEDVDVHVMQTTQLNGHTIHYKNASVTEEKDISIDGKPYKALVIESELWIQAGFETTYAADNEKWRKYHQNFNDKIQDKAQKSLVKSGFLNEEGYNVSHLVEWFVPGIGIVKTICYDSIGCISSISVWDSVK